MSMYKHAISLTCPNADTTVKDLATLQSSCPSVTPGISGNYFSIASEDRLGVAQTHQFQVKETGNVWGSYYYNDDGVKTKGTSADNSNQYSDMPRSYYNESNALGSYMNWYAITAESGSYNTISSSPNDSVCPAGWRLPELGTTSTTNQSWRNLLRSVYTTADSISTRKLPLSFVAAGDYRYHAGEIRNVDRYVNTWSSSTGSAKSKAYFVRIFAQGGQFDVDGTDVKVYGLTTRCVKK